MTIEDKSSTIRTETWPAWICPKCGAQHTSAECPPAKPLGGAVVGSVTVTVKVT
jgi:hypothetical protein